MFVQFQIPNRRPPSSSGPLRDKPKPAFGKKQFDNMKNNPVSGAGRSTLGGYSQSYGTITASGLAAIQSKKW